MYNHLNENMLYQLIEAENMHLHESIKSLRTGYFRELWTLREANARVLAEVERMREGKSKIASSEAYINQFEVNFFDITDGLVEPELVEAMKASVRLTHRVTLQRLAAWREKLIEAGIDPEDGLGNLVPDYFQSPEENTSTSISSVECLPLVIVNSPSTLDQAILASVTTADKSEDPLERTCEEESSQTVQLQSLSAVHLPSVMILVEKPDARESVSLSIIHEISLLRSPTIIEEYGIVTDPAPEVPLSDTPTQTKIYEYKSVASGNARDLTCKNSGVQTDHPIVAPSPPLVARPPVRDLSGDDKDLLTSYLEKFKASFLRDVSADSSELLKNLIDDHTFAPILDRLQQVSSGDDHSGPDETWMKTARDEHDEQHSVPNRFRRQVLSLKSEIADLEGRLAVQSRRLNRALKFIDGSKREKDDSAARAAMSLAKIKRVRDTVRKLRRQLISRERQVKVLSNSLTRALRHQRKDVSRPPHPGEAQEEESIHETTLDEDNLFVMTSRSTARIQNFSFEPLTDHARVSPRIQLSPSDRIADLVKQRHQLRLGTLHNLKPIVDD